MGKWTLPKLKKRLDAKDMTLEEAAYIAGELLQENAQIEVDLVTARTNARDGLLQAKRELDGLNKRCTRLEAQLTAEEQCAMNSGGILSDVCDLVFDDPERAATHGYEGVKEKIVEMKNQLRLYQIQIDKL